MFNSNILFVIFTYLSILIVIQGICPDGCTCSSKSVICTCNDLSWNSENTRIKDLRLTGFGSHLDYVDLFVIHSCDRVIISNDTFSGIELSEQIKFLSINLIEIEKNAFRGIRKSPKQFIIQNSGFDIISEYSFIGLTHVDHFWFKNVTINRIEKNAFSKLSNFNYIYFRQVDIGTIDSEAFGNMKNINYFYMRDNISINHLDNHVFKDSNIEEIMFEKCNVKATDYSLNGIHTKKLELIDTKWHTDKINKRTIIKQNIHHFITKNSTFNRIVPGLLYNTNTIGIDECQIHHLASINGYESKNINELQIRNSKIYQWHSHAINSNINKILIENSIIDKFHHRSIYNSNIESIVIDKSNIQYTSPKLFEKSIIKKLLLTETVIGMLTSNTFAFSKINTLLINEIKFIKIENRAFGLISSSQLQISGSIFPEFPQYLFDKSNITDLTILSTQFLGPPTRYVFSGLYAKVLRFTHCEIVCQLNDCEVNSLFFQSSIHHLSWTFEYNRCISSRALQTTIPSSLICTNSTEIIHESGLLCRRSIEVEECMCNKDDEIVVIPKTEAAIMTIGDCSNVLMVENNSPQLHSLYLYRIGTGIIQSIPSSLRRLNILHSTIRFEKSFVLQSIDSIVFNGVNIENVNERAFSESTINRLTFNNSKLSNVLDNSFSNSIINNLHIISTDIIESGNLYKHVKNAIITTSRLHNSEDISTIRNICLMNSSIECKCPDTNINLDQNRCDNDSNECINLNSTTTEYWRKTRNIIKNKSSCLNNIIRVNASSYFNLNSLLIKLLILLIGDMVLSFMYF